MSGERPLWPEGLRNKLKLPPVENQKSEALPKGVSAPVAKQPELSTPDEQLDQQPDSTALKASVVYSGEAVSPGSKPKALDTAQPDQATLAKRKKKIEQVNRWRQENRERVNAQRRERYHQNPEPSREQMREWRQQNPEKAREATRKWREKNRERENAQQRERYRRKKEAVNSLSAQQAEATEVFTAQQSVKARAQRNH
jgi:hypothetical protein